jgi:hypothetical protein
MLASDLRVFGLSPTGQANIVPCETVRGTAQSFHAIEASAVRAAEASSADASIGAERADLR